MYIIEKQLKKFSAAHRLVNGYAGKCRNLHGHNYKIMVSLSCQQLNAHGLVIDFNIITDLFDSYVQQNIDHGVLVCDSDTELLQFVQSNNQQHYILDNGRNTSVEVMAEELYSQFTQIIANNPDWPDAVQLHMVKIYETDTAWAAYGNNQTQITGSCCGNSTTDRE